MSEASVSSRHRTKSRTGCSTCKVRHIKCDESKPSCRRCSSTGRVCDGYSNVVNIGCGIRPGLARSKKETRYFQLFQQNTILGLMGFDHGSTFWTYMVLQFSEASPAVLHAVLALSAFHEHLDRDAAPETESYRLSLLEYNKSIGYLRSRQSRQPVQFTLTCCILFICLENAQANEEQALAHLRNGLSILQDWKSNTGSASEDLVMENLTQVFRRLDMQATVFLDSRQPELNATSAIQSPRSGHSALCFSSMRDAQVALEEIELRLFYVLTTKSTRHHSLESRDEMLADRSPLLHGLADRFKKWKGAFDAFSTRESESLRTKDLQLGVLLALHYETTSFMLDTKAQPNPDIETILGWESTLTRINELSRSLINSASSGSKFAFSADTGVIAPLYYSAMRATSAPVRQQAIEILRSVKWKEGFWNAETAARIAENVSNVKRAGMTGLPVTGGIPDLAKAHCVVTCF